MDWKLEKWVPFLILVPWGAFLSVISWQAAGIGLLVQYVGTGIIIIANLMGGRFHGTKENRTGSSSSIEEEDFFKNGAELTKEFERD
jgi:hypothetical protein